MKKMFACYLCVLPTKLPACYYNALVDACYSSALLTVYIGRCRVSSVHNSIQSRGDLEGMLILYITCTVIALSLTEPIEFIPRLGGLGLGATPRAPRETKKRIKKPGEEERKVCLCVCRCVLVQYKVLDMTV